MTKLLLMRTIHKTAGLRISSEGPTSEFLGIYTDSKGFDLFAISPTCIVMLSDRRRIEYSEVKDIHIDPLAKSSETHRHLILCLDSGEVISLQIDTSRDRFLDIFPIHAYIRRQAHNYARKP